MRIERETYKGHPILVIYENPDDRYPVKIGVKKAKTVLRAIREVKKFIEDNTK